MNALFRSHWIKITLFSCLGLSGAFAEEPVLNLQTTVERPYLARLNVGVGFYNSGWYNCNYYYPYYACDSGSYSSYIPFTAGVQFDIPLGGTNFLTPGFQFMTGTIDATYNNGFQQTNNSAHEILYEPTVDYVGKFGSTSSDSVGRFRLGGALYFGSSGGSGGGFRTGIGGSFFNTHSIGLGLDMVFEGGSFHGYWIGGIQLLISPEFHF